MIQISSKHSSVGTNSNKTQLKIGSVRPGSQPDWYVAPCVGRVNDPAPAAAAYYGLSAIRAASLKIRTNICRVSFPVWVF